MRKPVISGSNRKVKDPQIAYLFKTSIKESFLF